MSFFKISNALLFAAAAVLAFPQIARADDDSETETDTETTETTTAVYNLSGSTDFTIAENETVVVTQDIDGTYTGTISGDGALEKNGEANLTLDGEIALTYSNSISVNEGTLTLGNNLVLPESTFAIANSATIVISKNGDEELQLTIRDSDYVGTVVSNGTGTVQVVQIYGNALNVDAGTLVVKTAALFNEIYIADGATLQLGTGETDSLASLSGDVFLDGENAKIVFNRAALTGSSSSDFSYSGEISGSGEVVFEGTQQVLFTGGVSQTYTGKTTINAGGMVFERDDDAGTATLASPEIEVNAGGIFGGHVTVSGTVTVNGTSFSSYSEWESAVGEDTFGYWYAGAGILFADGGDTLTITGDLTIAETEASYVYTLDSDGNITGIDVEGNSGGAIRVNFTSAGAGKIVATGTVSLGGTVILAGADGLEVGQIAVIFESDPDTTTGEFTQVVYGSDNVILLTPGVGGIEEGQYGMATVESRNVRERASFDEHDGISDLVDYLEDNADEINQLVQAVAIASSDNVTDVVNNLSPLAYCALAEMAQRQAELELDMILQNVARARRNRPESPDGVRVPASYSFFSGVLVDDVNHDDDADAPVYDFSTVGAYAGAFKWLDDERLAGASFSAFRSSAKPHGSGGTLDDVAARLRIFATFAPKFADWFLTIGATGALHHYDISRETALGKNTGSLPGVDAGVFIAMNYRKELQQDLFLTPYLRFEYNFHYAGGITEHGSASRLELDHFVTNSYKIRFGSGFEHIFSDEKVLGIDFGFVAPLGEKPRISAEFVEFDDSGMTIDGTVNDGPLFEITPRASLGLGSGWTADFIWRVQTTFTGNVSQSIGFGIGKTF